jgi:glycosyltransferase involved in cell wall biosynthesis
MSDPIVSVLITVYNREKYVAAAIESVLAQAFTDYELIIVDDGSQDRSLEIARRYEGNPRVNVHVNERNLGDYPNRNKAASLARGKYLKYVDADDLMYPQCLELMVQGMESFPGAVLGVSRATSGVVYPAQLSSREAYEAHFLFRTGLFSSGPLDTIILRSAFEVIGRFDTARYTGDSLCWMTLARKAPVVIIAPELVWWRRHEDQESVAETKGYEVLAEVGGRRFRHILAALDAADCPLSEPDRHWVRARTVRLYARRILGRLLRGHFHYAKALLRASGQPVGAFASAVLKPGVVPGSGVRDST